MWEKEKVAVSTPTFLSWAPECELSYSDDLKAQTEMTLSSLKLSLLGICHSPRGSNTTVQ